MKPITTIKEGIEMKTYKIIRFKFKGSKKVIKKGLSLSEAQSHCQREDTHKIKKNGDVIWFDGYAVE